MSRMNLIKVFKPNSKQADFTVRSVTPKAGSEALQSELGDEVGAQALAAFKSLERLGADSMTFRAMDRKIKVELAHA